MDTGIPRAQQHLSLPVAAVLLHIKVVGKPPDATDSARLSATLNDAARALAMVAPIYSNVSGSGPPVKIDESVLLGATFTRRAQVLVTADGTRYECLTAKRGDVEDAAKILAASARFRNAPNGPFGAG